MDLLPFLLAILAAGVVIGGVTWYLLKRPGIPKKRPTAKRPAQTEQSIDKIAASTKQRISKAQKM